MKTTLVNKDVPPDLWDELLPRLTRYLPLVEDVLDNLYVHFSPDGDDFDAAITVDREYNQASMYVSGHYFTNSDEGREKTIAHELAHILLNPSRNLAFSIIENFTELDLREFLKERWNKEEEKVVTDLAKAFVQLTRSKEDASV